VKDDIFEQTTLRIDQGHIDWAKTKYGDLNTFLDKDDWFAASNLEGLIQHEYGHRITKGIMNSRKQYDEWAKVVDRFRIPVSGYGRTHGQEALAEIWSIYKTKGKAALKPEFIEFFNTHSSKIKIP
jgi:hypothetical protein